MAVTILVAAGTAGARDLSITRIVVDPDHRVSAPPAFIGPNAAVGHVPCDRNILGLDRPHRLALPTAASAGAAKAVHVAVLRVQFKQEVADNPMTTGDGYFDMRDTAAFFAEEGHAFEMAPHNRHFFDTVMGTMVRYYDVVSNGRLTITYDVFPADTNSAYTLDSSMSWYGARPPNDGLGDFVIDAVTKADADPDIVFSDYDGYVIFHAGSDRQHDFSPVTPTPNDLFTGFLRLLNPDLFVVVDGGADTVQDAVVLPETAIQDNRGTSLNGITAHEFGHLLGLVDMYSTRTGTTQVGDFSLMDNNAQEVGIDFGLPWSISVLFDILPVFPDAWSRAYLGFVTPRIVTPDSILAHTFPDSVRPFNVTAAEGLFPFNQVLKVPISAKEYYLVEFRSPDEDYNGDVGIRFDSTFDCVLGPSVCNNPAFYDSCIQFGRDYDFRLPVTTGGMLIWHVDEEVAYQIVPEFANDEFLRNNFDANTLQWNRERRFLEVVEADGLIDFGGNYYTGFGSQAELFLGGYKTEFGPATNPSTHTHTGAPSHLRFFDISAIYPPDTDIFFLHHMKVKLANERAAEGWPKAAGRSVAPELTVVRGGTADTVLAAAGRYVLAWTGDGQPLIGQLAGDRAVDSTPLFDFTYRYDTLTALTRADAPLMTGVSVGTYAAGTRAAAAVDATGKLYIWSFTDTTADGWADTIATVDLGAPAPKPPLWFDPDGDGIGGLFVASRNGVVVWWDNGLPQVDTIASAIRDWALVVGPDTAVYAAADMGLIAAHPLGAMANLGHAFESIVAIDDDRDGQDALFARDAGQIYRIEVTGTVRISNQQVPSVTMTGDLTSGDHDNNGVPSIFAAAGDWMAAFQPNLVSERNFPLRSNDLYPGAPLCPAVTVNQQTLFGGADGEVQAYSPEADQQPGWPLFAGDTVVSVATVQTGVDTMLVLARSTNGYIWGTKVAGGADVEGAWTQPRGNAQKQNRWNGTGAPAPTPSADILPAETVYAYPNPANRGPVHVRYYLGQASQVTLRVYDLAGNEVASGTASGYAGADNEWIWDASSVAPGVYFCRVQANAGGSDKVEFCKVAIIP
jgi:M6 family metalloprotease-like protein